MTLLMNDAKCVYSAGEKLAALEPCLFYVPGSSIPQIGVQRPPDVTNQQNIFAGRRLVDEGAKLFCTLVQARFGVVSTLVLEDAFWIEENVKLIQRLLPGVQAVSRAQQCAIQQGCGSLARCAIGGRFSSFALVLDAKTICVNVRKSYVAEDLAAWQRERGEPATLSDAQKEAFKTACLSRLYEQLRAELGMAMLHGQRLLVELSI